MSLEYKDYYATLGVPRFASQEDIRQAFRRLARRHHPDVAPLKKIAEEQFKEINEAYEVLSNPESRRNYDSLGGGWRRRGETRPRSNPPNRSGTVPARQKASSPSGQYEFHFRGTGFSDFFQNLLGAMSRPFRAPKLLTGGWFRDRNKGRDIEADLLVSLEEAIIGSNRKITVERFDGKGKKLDSCVYQVKVPPGVMNNQKIRLVGQGEPSTKEGPPGDLFLHVRYASHPDFHVDKCHLYTDIEIPPWEAVLGGRVEVMTLDGKAQMSLPPGTRNGQRFRLSGHGLPEKSGDRGDLFVTVSLQIPAHISAEEKEYWEQLAKHSKYHEHRK